jgi:hypothetical protein
MTCDLDGTKREWCADDCHTKHTYKSLQFPIMCTSRCKCECHSTSVPDPCDVQGHRRVRVITEMDDFIRTLIDREILGVSTNRPLPILDVR